MSSQNQKKKPQLKRKSNQICFTGPRIEEALEAVPEGIEHERMQKIVEEFQRGFHFLRDFGLAVSVFGSSRAKPSDRMYKEAVLLASLLAKDGFAVITGGGPGIMEAANKGAVEAGGRAAAINIQLPREQQTNPYVKESVALYYFFIRKVMLAFASDVYIFFPGGFGTLDEMFELVTLVQTKKIKPIPIILVDREYWTPLLLWIEHELYTRRGAVGKQDLEIYHLVDNAQEAFELISRMVVRP